MKRFPREFCALSDIIWIRALSLALPPTGDLRLARPRLPKHSAEDVSIQPLLQHQGSIANSRRKLKSCSCEESKDCATTLRVAFETIHWRGDGLVHNLTLWIEGDTRDVNRALHSLLRCGQRDEAPNLDFASHRPRPSFEPKAAVWVLRVERVTKDATIYIRISAKKVETLTNRGVSRSTKLRVKSGYGRRYERCRSVGESPSHLLCLSDVDSRDRPHDGSTEDVVIRVPVDGQTSIRFSCCHIFFRSLEDIKTWCAAAKLEMIHPMCADDHRGASIRSRDSVQRRRCVPHLEALADGDEQHTKRWAHLSLRSRRTAKDTVLNRDNNTFALSAVSPYYRTMR